ncbi:MAG: hypothetical protein MPF33_01460 [Candidatus Aramenus sp.]|nr:hypothetical protein [Candidatus Aramenus sp.]
MTLALSLVSALVVVPVNEVYRPRREVKATSEADKDVINKKTNLAF